MSKAANAVSPDVTRSGGFRPDIQGLRAVAVLAVIAFHAGELLPGGYVGVDVFFVISGFVIMRSLLRELSETGGVSLRDFYRRRVRRLTPALTLMIAVVMVLGVLLAPTDSLRNTPETGIAALLLHANVQLLETAGYFAISAQLNPLLHTWSLSLEEQFYLVFPLIVLALLWLADRRSRGDAAGGREDQPQPSDPVVVGLVVVGAVSLLLALRLGHGGPVSERTIAETRQLGFFLMPSRMWQFVLGGLLARWNLRDDRRLVIRGGAWMGAALLAASFLGLGDVGSYPGWWAVLPTVGTALVIANPTGPLVRSLQHPVMVRMGDVSYGWYLWHWPAIVIADAAGLERPLLLAAVGLATYLLAEASYRQVEVPYKRSEVGREAHGWVRIVMASVAAVALGVGLVQVPFSSDDVPDASEALAAGQPHRDRNCSSTRLAPDVVGCQFGSGDTHVVLFGDSNAGQFTEALVSAGATRGWRLTVLVRSACPLLDIEVERRGVLDAACMHNGAAQRRWIADTAPDVVLLAVAGDVYLADGGWKLSRAGRAGATAYEAGLRDFAAQLEPVGTDLIVVNQVPKFALDENTSTGLGACSAIVFAIVPSWCVETMPREAALARRAPALEVEARVTETTPAIRFDPFDLLCPGEVCAERLDGTWLYRDVRHISVAAAEQLAPAFADVVEGSLAS